jgi:hypothetical protein
MEIIGMVSGASTALAATSIPFLPSSPTPVSDNFSKFFSIFGILGKRKKKRDDWGMVFDAETRRPIAGVSVGILSQGRMIDHAVTDQQGRFGFLASAGTYTFQISKDKYKLSTKDEVDELYGDLYTGKPFSIQEGEMAKMNIAMESTQVNWKDFTQRKLAAYSSIWSVIKKTLSSVHTGFIFLCHHIFFTDHLNITIAIYLAMIIYNLSSTKSFGIPLIKEQACPIAIASFTRKMI